MERLVGGTGGDRLYGDDGSDTATYWYSQTSGVTANLTDFAKNKGDAAGDKYYSVENLTGTKFVDTLIGNSASNTLKGESNADILTGLAGADKLYGGAGRDKLTGGGGADKFVFTKRSDSWGSSDTRDTIYDFLHSENDKIELSLVDANERKASDQAFTFIGPSKFHKVAGELRYTKGASDTYIYGDVDGDGKADFSIHLDDAVSLVKGDFLL